MNERTEEKQNGGKWYVSHSIPVSVIVTVAIQTAVIVWWAAGLDVRLTDHLNRGAHAHAQVRLNSIEREQGITGVNVKNIRDDIEAIDKKLDRLLQNPNR